MAALIGSLADGPLWAIGPNGPFRLIPGVEISDAAKSAVRTVASGIKALQKIGATLDKARLATARQVPPASDPELEELLATIASKQSPAARKRTTARSETLAPCRNLARSRAATASAAAALTPRICAPAPSAHPPRRRPLPAAQRSRRPLSRPNTQVTRGISAMRYIITARGVSGGAFTDEPGDVLFLRVPDGATTFTPPTRPHRRDEADWTREIQALPTVTRIPTRSAEGRRAGAGPRLCQRTAGRPQDPRPDHREPQRAKAGAACSSRSTGRVPARC